MTGIQYTVDEYNTNEPALFVIKKQERMSPRSVVLLDIYYILDGIIYQSPVLMDLLRSRTAKMAIHLKRAFTELQELHNPAEETPDGDRVEKHEDDDASIRETGSVISEATTRAATRKRKLRLPAFDRVLEDVASSLKN
jgi:mediator of RNA polymerase II transcription subunit 6